MGMLDNFQSAYAEYERHLQAPYDFGGALFDYEQYAQEQEDIVEDMGNLVYDRMKDNELE